MARSKKVAITKKEKETLAMAPRKRNPSGSLSAPKTPKTTFQDIIHGIANMNEREQARLSAWFTSLACPGFRIHKEGTRYFVDNGDGQRIPIKGCAPGFFDDCKKVVSFIDRLQRDLLMFPFTTIWQECDKSRNSVADELHGELEVVAGRLHHEKMKDRVQRIAYMRKTQKLSLGQIAEKEGITKSGLKKAIRSAKKKQKK